MLKKCLLLAVATVFFTFNLLINSASAIELTEDVRTFALNEQGETTVLSLKELKNGTRLFNYACAQCHALGVTKTNPDVNLSPESLSGAVPNRNNIVGIVDYMKEPTSYDGFEDISLFHPSLESSDIYKKMRNLTEDDLYAIAGYILLQPKVRGIQWGGGKYLR